MSDLQTMLSSLTETERTEAMERFAILRPIVEQGVSQTEVARLHHLLLRTVQRWMQHYRMLGLSGLAKKKRKDRGLRRGMPPELVRLIEGLALQKPKRSAASIHRQVVGLAQEHDWTIPSYSRVYDIIQKIDPAFVTLTHKGAKAYGEEFDLLYRREASHANACGRPITRSYPFGSLMSTASLPNPGSRLSRMTTVERWPDIFLGFLLFPILSCLPNHHA